MNVGDRALASFRLNPLLLTLGSFDLVGAGTGPWVCEALADGTDLAGNAVPVEVAIQTLIQDGSVSYTEKYDNSTITIKVCISGPDAEALDDGAAALFAELGKPNTLTYGGPQAVGLVAWDVVNSRLERNSDDLAEVRNERYYTITLSCLPFRRAVTETVTPALDISSGSTTFDVDTCGSATGWTGIPAPVTTSSGSVRVQYTGAADRAAVLEMTRAGAVDMTATPILVVDWDVVVQGPGAGPEPQLTVNETPGSKDPNSFGLPRIAEGASPIAGKRTWFFAGEVTLAELYFRAASFGGVVSTTNTRILRIHNVAKTDVLPGAGKQRLRSIEIRGSAPTPGAIAIEHEEDALGDVLFYSWPDDGSGYQPPLRQFKTSGTDSADADGISSLKTVVSTGGFVAQVPTTRIINGGHRIDARLRATGSVTATVSYSITTIVNGVDIGPTITGSRSVALTTAWSIASLGRLMLPTRSVARAGAGAYVQVTLTATGGTIYVDEAWLFNREVGRLTTLSVGTGTPSAGGPSNRIFMEPATALSPSPTIRRGFAADRSDSFHPPGMTGWQMPVFKGRTGVLVVTTGAEDAAVSFRHFERKAG